MCIWQTYRTHSTGHGGPCPECRIRPAQPGYYNVQVMLDHVVKGENDLCNSAKMRLPKTRHLPTRLVCPDGIAWPVDGAVPGMTAAPPILADSELPGGVFGHSR
jgi:hypothetical protein